MKGHEGGARGKSGRVFVAVVLGVSTVVLLSSVAGGKEVLRKVLSANSLWISLAFLNALGIISVDALRIALLSSGCDKKLSFWDGMKASIYGFYTSAITPFASGGQPFQIYYLTRIGLKVERSSMIVGVKFISSFTISVIWGLFAIVKYGEKIASIHYIGKLMYLGVAATLVFYAFFLSLVVSSRFGRWFLSLPVVVIPLAFLLKKNKEDIYSIVRDKVDAYKHMLVFVWRHSRVNLLLTFLLSFLMVTMILSGPYIALQAVGGNLPFFEGLSLTAAMSMIFYFIPTPGASGGVEGVFYLVFSKMLSSNLAASSLIVWRFFSYHLSLLLGIILGSGYMIRGDTDG